jgi:hypothetical protein
MMADVEEEEEEAKRVERDTKVKKLSVVFWLSDEKQRLEKRSGPWS